MKMQHEYADERAMLMDCPSYDAETGIFRWKKHRKSTMIGVVAGCCSGKGYVRISVRDKSYKAHRLAWLFVYGVWPSGDIDHISMNKADNRICNLRDLNRSENMQNRRKANANNKTSGLLGVTWSKSCEKFVAQIHVRGARIHLGVFEDPHKAHEAYVQAKRSLHPAGKL